MKKLIGLMAVATSLCFIQSCTNYDDTEDLASLLVGTYKGDAQDDFDEAKNVKVIITRISNDIIEIAPAELNFTNSTIQIQLVIKDNIITHETSQAGLTFKAEPAKRKIPMEFSTNAPIQTFKGALD